MSLVKGVGSAQTAALGGIRREVLRFTRAAEEVALTGAAAHNASVVQISDEARAALSQAMGAGLEGALLETREAGSMLAANVRVLSTADDMNRDLLDLVGRRR